MEVLCEKDAVAGSIQAVTDELLVRVRVSRGYLSTTLAHEIAMEIRASEKPMTIFVLSDHDPSGRDLIRDAEDRIRDYLGDWKGKLTVRRLAIFPQDIAKFNLPKLRIKAEDSRSDEFERKYGPDCVELAQHNGYTVFSGGAK